MAWPSKIIVQDLSVENHCLVPKSAALYNTASKNAFGFHNKMELINRQAYGYRNFENYRMRVKVLCS